MRKFGLVITGHEMVLLELKCEDSINIEDMMANTDCVRFEVELQCATILLKSTTFTKEGLKTKTYFLMY